MHTHKTYVAKLGKLIVTFTYTDNPLASSVRVYRYANFGLVWCYGVVLAGLYGDPSKVKMAFEAEQARLEKAQASCKREGG